MLLGQHAHHAEIQGGQHPVGAHDEVGRVRIRVENPVLEDLGQHVAGPHGGDAPGVHSRPPVSLGVRKADPLDVLHGQHPGRAQPGVHGGDGQRAVGAEVAAEQLHGPRFVLEIQLQGQHPGEVVDQGDQPEGAQPRQGPLQQERQVHQDGQVRLDQLLDSRALDLEGQLLPLAGHGAVDLGDGSAGQGLRIEAGKTTAPFRPQLPDQHRLQALEVQGGRPVLQLLQLRGDLVGQKVGAQAQELAELDEGGPQLLEQQAQAGSGAQAPEAPRRGPGQPAMGQQRLAQLREAVEHQAGEDLPVALQLAEALPGTGEQHPGEVRLRRSFRSKGCSRSGWP